MKKLTYILLSISLFFLFSTVAFADSFKCMQCDGGTYWTNRYGEKSSRCYGKSSVSDNNCSNKYTDVKVTCTYGLYKGYNYTTDDNVNYTVYDTDEYTDDELNQYTVIINFDGLNVKATYYDYWASSQMDIAVIGADFYNVSTGNFYCPKYIYGDTTTMADGVTIFQVSGSKEIYTGNTAGLGTEIYDRKNEYKLIRAGTQQMPQKKCYDCDGVLMWLEPSFMFSGGLSTTCREVTGKTEATCKTDLESIGLESKCYEVCEDYLYSSGTHFCTHQNKMFLAQPDSTKYYTQKEVDIHKCGKNIKGSDLTSCGVYKYNSFIPGDNNSIEVYKSKYGAYLLLDGNYIYVRDTAADSCPKSVFNFYTGTIVIQNGNEYRTASENYYISGDSKYYDTSCPASGTCAEYILDQTLDDYNKGGSSNPGGNSGSQNKCAVDHSSDVACGALYNIPKQLPQLTTLFMNIIKIFTPIILIIKGMIDLFKAVTGNNDQEIAKARSKFFKRLIPAIAVFLVILITQFVFGFVGTDSENNTFLACTNCFLNNNCSNTPLDKIQEYCEKKNSFNGSTSSESNINNNSGTYTNIGDITPATPGVLAKDAKQYWSEDKYNSKLLMNPDLSKCRQNSASTGCNENYEEGYIRVTNGVFYFPYVEALNGNPIGYGNGKEGLNKIFNDRLEAFFAEARKNGYYLRLKPNVGDGYRDISTQEYYKCCETRGKEYNNSVRTIDKRLCSSDPSKDKCGSRNSASTPGKSPHGWGLAADLDLSESSSYSPKSTAAVKWAHLNAERFGLTFPVSNEDWHIEPLYVCDINGGDNKYGSCTKQKQYYCPGDPSNPSGARVHTCNCGSC